MDCPRQHLENSHPLKHAIMGGDSHFDCFKWLIACGHHKEVIVERTKRITPLAYCVENDYLRALQYLVDRPETYLNQIDYEGQSPLFTAVRKRCKETIEILLRGGADASIPNDAGINSLGLAINMGQLDIVNMILDSTSWFMLNRILSYPQGIRGNPPLIMAIEASWLPIVKSLLRRGAKIGRTNNFLENELEASVVTYLTAHTSVKKKQYKIVQQLFVKEMKPYLVWPINKAHRLHMPNNIHCAGVEAPFYYLLKAGGLNMRNLYCFRGDMSLPALMQKRATRKTPKTLKGKVRKAIQKHLEQLQKSTFYSIPKLGLPLLLRKYLLYDSTIQK